MKTVENDFIDDSVLDIRLEEIVKNSTRIKSLSHATHAIYIPKHGFFDISNIKEEILGDQLNNPNAPPNGSKRFGIHFKYKPKNALNEKIAYLLDKLLFRSTDEELDAFVNPNQLVVIKNGPYTHPVLASQTIFGPTLRSVLSTNEVSKVKKIDSANFTRLYILHLLLRPGDAKTDNFMLSETGKLVAIDHEKIFAEDAVLAMKDGEEFTTTHITSVAFLLDHFFTEIDDKTKQQIIALDVEELFFDLVNAIEIYAKPPESCPAQWHIDLSFKPNALARLYGDLKLIKEFFISNKSSETTHAQLMESVNPNLHRFYSEYKKHAHHNYFSIEKMVGTLITQGGLEKNEEVSFEELSHHKPTYKKVITQHDLLTQKNIDFSKVKQELVNDIDYECFTLEKRDRVLNKITALAPQTTQFQLNNCKISRLHFDLILQLPLKKLTLHGVQFTTDDLLYFIKQSKASVELYRCPSVTHLDLNYILAKRHLTVTISVRLNDDSVLTFTSKNITHETADKNNTHETADYLYQVDRHIKTLHNQIPKHILELKRYLLENRFYERAFRKLKNDYPNGESDNFTQHTLITVIQETNNPNLTDSDRITLNRELYKALHWRHQKLFTQIIRNKSIISSHRQRELIERDLINYRKNKSHDTRKILTEIQKVSQSNSDLVKKVYLYKDQCTTLSKRANHSVNALCNEVENDCYLSDQDLLPFLETMKEINYLIETCNLSWCRRLLSWKFMSGTAFKEKLELLKYHKQVFGIQSQNHLKERLSDRENDLVQVRAQLDNLMNEQSEVSSETHSETAEESVQSLRNQVRTAVENTIDQCSRHQVSMDDLHIPLQEIKIGRLLRSDCYAEVYLAEYQYRPVIVKKLTKKNMKQKSKFERDIQFRKTLRHPNIAELKGVYDSQKEPIMVIDTTSTKTLNQYLNETLLNDQQKFRLILGIARALYYIHEVHKTEHAHEVHKTAHGNLCSQNILITESGEPLLDNFGFSVSDKPTLLPTSAYNNATISYFPPEANHHCLIARPKIDIYCFGILVNEIYSAQGQYLPIPVKDINKAATQNYFPSFIEELIHKCTNVSAIHRPNIIDILEDLKKNKPLDSTYRDNQIDSINKQIDRADKLVGQALERRSSNNQNKLTEIRKLYESTRQEALRLAQLTGSYRAYCIVGHLNILLLCKLNTDRQLGKQFTSTLEVNRNEHIGNAFKFFDSTVRYYPEDPTAKGYLDDYKNYNPHKEKQSSNGKIIYNHRKM